MDNKTIKSINNKIIKILNKINDKIDNLVEFMKKWKLLPY